MADKRRDLERPGNVLATQASVERHMLKLASAVYRADASYFENPPPGFQLKTIKFKSPPHAGGEWLAIVTAELEGAPSVAFHSGDSFPDCLRGLCSKLVNGSLRWKEDEYAK